MATNTVDFVRYEEVLYIRSQNYFCCMETLLAYIENGLSKLSAITVATQSYFF